MILVCCLPLVKHHSLWVLYEYISQIKQLRLDRLAPIARGSSSACYTTEEHKLIVTIPPDLFLSNEEYNVLSKGLNFVPLDETQNDFEIHCDVDAFFKQSMI